MSQFCFTMWSNLFPSLLTLLVGWQARDSSSKQVLSSSWDGRPFGHNRHGPKFGGLWPFGGGGAGSQSNTMLPVTRPTSLSSGILIHPAVWPQQIQAKTWGLCPSGEMELGPHLIQCCLAESYLHAKVSSWSIQPFGHNTPALQTEQDNYSPIA